MEGSQLVLIVNGKNQKEREVCDYFINRKDVFVSGFIKIREAKDGDKTPTIREVYLYERLSRDLSGRLEVERKEYIRSEFTGTPKEVINYINEKLRNGWGPVQY